MPLKPPKKGYQLQKIISLWLSRSPKTPANPLEKCFNMDTCWCSVGNDRSGPSVGNEPFADSLKGSPIHGWFFSRGSKLFPEQKHLPDPKGRSSRARWGKPSKGFGEGRSPHPPTRSRRALFRRRHRLPVGHVQREALHRAAEKCRAPGVARAQEARTGDPFGAGVLFLLGGVNWKPQEKKNSCIFVGFRGEGSPDKRYT